MIISDHHISINNTTREVFPLVSHSLCGFHMNQNVRNRFKNENVATIFDHASRVYCISNFDNQMKELRKIHKKAYQYLLEVGIHKWMCTYSSVRRYSLMTTNIVESLNSCLKHVCKLLITGVCS